MSKLRRLSGAQLVAIIERSVFQLLGKKGVISSWQETWVEKQILTVPNHKEIDTGTLRAIYRQVLAYIPEAELRNCFYSE